MNRLRNAFTLIEILVSVLILSVSFVAVLKIHSQNREQVIYITKRNKHVLQDSFFLDKNIMRYHRSKKNAYDVLSGKVHVKEDQSRKILKKIERNIYIGDDIPLVSGNEKQSLSATANKIMLKNDFSSSYFHFTIRSF